MNKEEEKELPINQSSRSRDKTSMEDRFYTPNYYDYHIGFEIWHRPTSYIRRNMSEEVQKKYEQTYFAGPNSYFGKYSPDRTWYNFIRKMSFALHPKLEGYLYSHHTMGSGDIVKYLDKEDIESLMWTFTGSNGICEFYEMDKLEDASLKDLAWEYAGTPGYKITKYKLTHDYEQKYVKIEAGFGEDYTCIYDGYVRNRSELFKLMPMLNIDITKLKEWHNLMPLEKYKSNPNDKQETDNTTEEA